ncbi:MAG: oligopeptide:H+ symporter, partial [Burkholderiales bacterium]
LGIKRTIITGLILILLAFALLISAGTNTNLIYIALATYILGMGIFKPNPSNLLSLFYTKGSDLDRIYTYYYMAINIGALLGFSIIPVIATKYDYNWAFICLGTGIALAVLSFTLFHAAIKHVDNASGNHAIRVAQVFKLVLAAISIIGLIILLLKYNRLAQIFLFSLFGLSLIYYFRLLKQADTTDKKKMQVALVLMLQYMLYFILYIQTVSSVTFFGLHNCNLNFLGIHFDEQQFNVFNSLSIIILSPALSVWYKKNDRASSFITKFAIGNVLMGISFLILFISTYFSDSNYQVNLFWVLIVFILFSLGELLVGAVGLSMIATLIPNAHKSFAYGLWFVIGAVGMKLGGQIAEYFAIDSNITEPKIMLASFAHLFGLLGSGITLLGILFFFLVPKLKKLLSK